MGNEQFKMMDKQVTEAIVKQLWPTMLFLVVMSLISLYGARIWSADLNSIHIVISYWLWFFSMLIITAFGLYVFHLDARIQFKRK